jgi:hypothetical protein
MIAKAVMGFLLFRANAWRYQKHGFIEAKQ